MKIQTGTLKTRKIENRVITLSFSKSMYWVNNENKENGSGNTWGHKTYEAGVDSFEREVRRTEWILKQPRMVEAIKPYVLGKIKTMGPISAKSCFNEIKTQCSNPEIMNSTDYDIEMYLEECLNKLIISQEIEIALCGIDTINFR